MNPTRKDEWTPPPVFDRHAVQRRRRLMGLAFLGMFLVFEGVTMRRGVYMCGWWICMAGLTSVRHGPPDHAAWTKFPVFGAVLLVLGAAACAVAGVLYVRHRRQLGR